MTDGRTQKNFPVALIPNRISGHCGNPADQWPTEIYGIGNGGCCSNVLADDTKARRNATRRNLFARKNLNKLLFTTRWIFRRNGYNVDVVFFIVLNEGIVKRCNGFGLIVFNANKAALCAEYL